MDDTSITALKSAFIRSQVRHLEAPLEPSTQWRDLIPTPADEGRLSDKVINDLVAKVNEKIRQHNRLIFSTQSQRHVAEQIESLHWNLVSADTERADLDTVVVRRDAELTNTNTLRQALPEEYDDLHLHPDVREEEGDAAVEAQRERYTALREELLELGRERDGLKKKVARYRQLRTLMAPLEDPQTDIQPNLVTRDGELSQELEKMRVLLARVTGRVGELSSSSSATTSVSRTQGNNVFPQTDQQKLAQVLDLG